MKNALLAALVLGLAVSVSVAAEEQVDNPQYKNWSSFKVGATTSYTMTTSSEMQGQKVEMKMTMTSTLKELTAEKAVVEMVAEMTMNGKSQKMPAQTQTIPAKVDKSKADLGGGTVPEGTTVTKTGEGDEEITVAGKKYKCHWIELTIKGDKATGTTKVWTAKDVPGGMVKNLTNMEAPMKSTMTMELTEFKAAG